MGKCSVGELLDYPKNKLSPESVGDQFLIELSGFDDNKKVFSVAYWEGISFSRNDVKRFAKLK